MKLTGWFSQDKIADNSRVQTPNNANTEQVNRQIRALVPGQTLRGEVVSREGNNAQIRLLQDVLVDAKVDADIRLELGQNITFQVKNNRRNRTESVGYGIAAGEREYGSHDKTTDGCGASY